MPAKINWGKGFHFICAILNLSPFRWFFGFGTLLTIIRDKSNFPKYDDIDVCLSYDNWNERVIHNFCDAHGWIVKKKIINDVTGEALYMTIKAGPDIRDTYGPLEVCFFLWYEHNGIYWHCFDEGQENKKSGVPSKYRFRGIPKEWMDDNVLKIPMLDTSMEGRIPQRYGCMLDEWYPDWKERRNTGTSFSRWTIEMKSCGQFKDNSYTKCEVKCPVTGFVYQMGRRT